MTDKIYYTSGPAESLISTLCGLQRFREENAAQFSELTAREFEILAHVATGYKTDMIAQKLNISAATVHNHRTRICEKLNIESQADYYKYALAFDLIPF